MKITNQILLAALFLSTLNFQPATVFAQGSLTPPGAPAPTMKSLDQIEPRMPISALPLDITAAGSYYLTTNLTGVAGFDGIQVSADNVTIDLNGFSLTGAAGSSSGVNMFFARRNFHIRNGTITDWPGGGITCGLSVDSRAENLRVAKNSSEGINLGINSVVADCISVSNTFNGITVAVGGIVQNCVASRNLNNGILARSGSTVINCAAEGNSLKGIVTDNGVTVKNCNTLKNLQEGIRTGSYCTIADCSSVSNQTQGFWIFDGSTLSGCTAARNGSQGIFATEGCNIRNCTTFANTGNGIEVGVGSTVAGCTTRANVASGISITGGSCLVVDNLCSGNGAGGTDAGILIAGIGTRIEGNNCVSNKNYGIRATTINNLIFKNSARTNPTNFLFAATSTFGPTNTTTGLITITSPYANFEF